jgi:Zn-dependent M32 family carboxypeptidase
MKFKIVEDVTQDIETVEHNSNLILEFQIYTPDESNPEADQYVAQLEQRLAAFGVENSEQKNESGKSYSMYRLIGKKFQSTQQIPEFFQKEFTDFVKLTDQIWKQSNNFIRIVIVDDSKPPKRIPGRTYTLLSTSDYQDMLMALKGD